MANCCVFIYFYCCTRSRGSLLKHSSIYLFLSIPWIVHRVKLMGKRRRKHEATSSPATTAVWTLHAAIVESNGA